MQLTGHLAAALDRLLGPDAWKDDRFGIAVSGGPDSMALLHAIQQFAPGRVWAATVDHGLRPEAADEAKMVADFCAERAIDHSILRPASPITGSVQAAARTARYALLEEWRMRHGLTWLLTAHHADDQLETLLMRLRRGSGTSGLAGVRSRQGTILRPLLGVRRAELETYCITHAIPIAQDPSNQDLAFDRVRVRQALSQAQDQPIVEWLDPISASASASHLAEDAAALDWAADHLAADAIRPCNSGLILSYHSYPRALWRRILLLALHQIDPACDPRGGALDHAMDQMQAGTQTMLGNVLIQPNATTGDAKQSWTLSPAPPRSSISA